MLLIGCATYLILNVGNKRIVYGVISYLIKLVPRNCNFLCQEEMFFKVAELKTQVPFQIFNYNMKYTHAIDNIYNAKFTLYKPWAIWHSLELLHNHISEISLLALAWNWMRFYTKLVFTIVRIPWIEDPYSSSVALLRSQCHTSQLPTLKFKSKKKRNFEELHVFVLVEILFLVTAEI